MATMAAFDGGPSAVRFPRGEGVGVPLPEVPETIEVGTGEILREGHLEALAEGHEQATVGRKRKPGAEMQPAGMIGRLPEDHLDLVETGNR